MKTLSNTYFKNNTTEKTAAVRWDVFIISYVILRSYTSSKSRDFHKKRILLESKIKTSQNLVINNNTTTAEKELLTVKPEYNTVSGQGSRCFKA